MQFCPAPQGGTGRGFTDPSATAYPVGHNGAIQWLFGLQQPINGMPPANQLFGEKYSNVYPEGGKLISSQKQDFKFFITSGHRYFDPRFSSPPPRRSFQVFIIEFFYLYTACASLKCSNQWYLPSAFIIFGLQKAQVLQTYHYKATSSDLLSIITHCILMIS